MENAAHIRLVFISTDSYDAAKQISRILVSERLAACCNIIPGISSVYEWQGAIEESQEYLILVKTSEAKLAQLEARVTEIHSYDIPEIISFKLESSSGPYLSWLDNVLKQE